MGASQQGETAAVRAKQLIKLTFAVSLETGPFIIKQTLLLYLFSSEEGGVPQCDKHELTFSVLRCHQGKICSDVNKSHATS